MHLAYKSESKREKYTQRYTFLTVICLAVREKMEVIVSDSHNSLYIQQNLNSTTNIGTGMYPYTRI